MTNTSVYKWSTFDRVFNTILTFGGNIALAWLLTPADFGLLAMVGIFTAIAYNISSCGLGDGIIRKLHPEEIDYSTMFVFNAAVGLLFGTAFFAGAPLISAFYDHNPDITLIMRAIGICFFLQSLGMVQETRLRKELRVKQLAIVHLSATALSVGLGIMLALCGGSYWGLVSCRVFMPVFVFIFSVFATRWFPGLRFSRESFRDMFGYGSNLMLSYLMIQIGRNINGSVLGRISAAESGIYSQAQKMNDVPFGISDSSLTQPFFTVVSAEANDGRRHNLVHEMFSTVVLTNVTMTLLLGLLSYPGFHLFFGTKWLECVPVFRVLICFGLLLNIKQFIITVMKAHSQTAKVRNLTIVETVIQLAVLVAVFHLGIMWIAASQVIAAAIILIFYFRIFCRLEVTSLRRIIGEIIPPLAAPVAAFVITLAGYTMWVDVVSSLFNVVFTITVFAATFLVVCSRYRLPVYEKLFALLRLQRRKQAG